MYILQLTSHVQKRGVYIYIYILVWDTHVREFPLAYAIKIVPYIYIIYC